jgi:hypothetical protein
VHFYLQPYYNFTLLLLPCIPFYSYTCWVPTIGVLNLAIFPCHSNLLLRRWWWRILWRGVLGFRCPSCFSYHYRKTWYLPRTELYFSIPKLKKIPSTNECRPLYSSVNRLIYVAVHSSVNRWMYGMPPMKFKNSYLCAYSLPAPPTHSASCHILTLNHCRCHRPSAAATLVPPPALPRVGAPPLIAWLRLFLTRRRSEPPPLALPMSAYLCVSPSTALIVT